MGGKLVSAGLSLSALSLAGCERQLPCGDRCKEYVVHSESGFVIHCIESIEKQIVRLNAGGGTLDEGWSTSNLCDRRLSARRFGRDGPCWNIEMNSDNPIRSTP